MNEEAKAVVRRQAAGMWVKAWSIEIVDALSQNHPELRRRFHDRMKLALSVGQWRGKVGVWKDEMEVLLS